MNKQDVYYVTADKQFGVATELPQNAYPISKDVFELLQLNPNYLDIEIVKGVVHLTVSLISYKRQAIVEVETSVSNLLLGSERLTFLTACVVTHQDCFDTETETLLSASEARELLGRSVARQNKVRQLGKEYKSKINDATSPTAVDELLEAFENSIGKV